MLFRGARIAVFVDGCFWHLCPEHGTMPKSNSEWWVAKLTGNVRRDRDTDELLRQAGWLPIRIWEHQDAVPAADAIEAIVRRRTLHPQR